MRLQEISELKKLPRFVQKKKSHLGWVMDLVLVTCLVHLEVGVLEEISESRVTERVLWRNILPSLNGILLFLLLGVLLLIGRRRGLADQF